MQQRALRRNPPQIMTRKEVAIYVGLSLRTISDLVVTGELCSVRVGDRRLIRLEDLKGFLEAKRSPIKSTVPDLTLP